MGLPVIFKQNRLGLNTKAFTFYKFRTMTNNNDEKGTLLPDKDRLTNFGKFLRRTSIDELPSFINVLKGDMSLVGPRPLLMEYLDRYSSDQAHRHDVKPGITGLAQIKGRNTLSWEEKFKYDIHYVDNHNIFLDLKILFLTVLFVLRFKGISPNNQEIMPEFRGGDVNESIDKTNKR
jgi:lipopolysaccharide/colanic/teichoic acid biosynthesis glycosyltransferase